MSCFVSLQDLHLHKFFQHCQLMRTASEGNPAELIKYLKVRCCEAEHSQFISFGPCAVIDHLQYFHYMCHSAMH